MQFLKQHYENCENDKYFLLSLALCDSDSEPLGVLESDMYYNANVGGRRFYRPVSSYTRGINHWRYKGPFRVTFEDGRIDTITDVNFSDYCKANGFNNGNVSKVYTGLRNNAYGIIKLEYKDEW